MFDTKEKPSEIKKVGVLTETDLKLAERIHVMPERFYVPQKKNWLGLVLIIVLAVVVVGGLSVAGYYLNENLRKSRQPLATDQTTETRNQNINNNSAINQAVDQNVNVNETVNLNVNTDVATTTPTSTPANTNSNVNINPDLSGLLPATTDTDGDGLTDAEETILGTRPDSSDTDGDGYSDSSELLSGYDPTRPKALLVNAGLFKTYNNPKYSIDYPSFWQQKELASDEVIFQASNGEFVAVTAILNSDKLSLLSWYQKQSPDANLNFLTQLTVNNLEALRLPNQRTYYLANPNDLSQIYLIDYNVGNNTQVSFPTIFSLMIKSFELIP